MRVKEFRAGILLVPTAGGLRSVLVHMLPGLPLREAGCGLPRLERAPLKIKRPWGFFPLAEGRNTYAEKPGELAR